MPGQAQLVVAATTEAMQHTTAEALTDGGTAATQGCATATQPGHQQ